MGNDGGTIARGKDLRAVFGTDSKATTGEERLQQHEMVCALTSLPLSKKGKSERIVSDYKGKLVLKEQLLEALLAKVLALKENFKHVKSLKDVVDVQAMFNKDDCLVCPISGAERNQHIQFCYLRTCGCVFAAKVLNELRSHLKASETDQDAAECECPKCGKLFMFNFDVVVINPDDLAKIAEVNERSYKYLTDTLKVTHAKKERKRKRSDDKKEKKEERKKSKPSA